VNAAPYILPRVCAVCICAGGGCVILNWAIVVQGMMTR